MQPLSLLLAVLMLMCVNGESDVEAEACEDDPTWLRHQAIPSPPSTCAEIAEYGDNMCRDVGDVYKSKDGINMRWACRKLCHTCGLTPTPTEDWFTMDLQDCIAEALDADKRDSWDEGTEAHCCAVITRWKGNPTPWGCPLVCSDMDMRHLCRNAGVDADGKRCAWRGKVRAGKCEAAACSDFTKEKKCGKDSNFKRGAGLTCYWKNNACGSESNADVPCSTYKKKSSCLKTGKLAKCMWEKKTKQCYGPDDPEPQIPCSIWKNPKKCAKEKDCFWALDTCFEG